MCLLSRAGDVLFTQLTGRILMRQSEACGIMLKGTSEIFYKHTCSSVLPT
jgi:hypothetical protein